MEAQASVRSTIQNDFRAPILEHAESDHARVNRIPQIHARRPIIRDLNRSTLPRRCVVEDELRVSHLREAELRSDYAVGGCEDELRKPGIADSEPAADGPGAIRDLHGLRPKARGV